MSQVKVSVDGLQTLAARCQEQAAYVSGVAATPVWTLSGGVSVAVK